MKHSLFIFIGILSLTGVFAFFANSFIELKKVEIENEARFQCAQSSRYTATEKGGSVVWYPVEDIYQKCLQEKNIK